MRRTGRTVVVCALLVGLSGCSTVRWLWGGGESSLVCPAATVAPDLDALATFNAGAGATKTVGDVQLAGKINAVSSHCTADSDDSKAGIAESLTINLLAARASESTDPQPVLPYFIAVIDDKNNIVDKQAYGARAEFPGDRKYRIWDEKVSVRIPAKNPADGAHFRVVVGFALSAEQLAFNRAHRNP